MNEKPGMAEDFVLNGNCTTSTDQELVERLCTQPEQVQLTPPVTQDLPRVGNDLGFAIPFIVAVVFTLLVIAYTKKK